MKRLLVGWNAACCRLHCGAAWFAAACALGTDLTGQLAACHAHPALMLFRRSLTPAATGDVV